MELFLIMRLLMLYILPFGLFLSQGNAQETICIPEKMKMEAKSSVAYQAIFSQQFDFNIPVKASLLKPSIEKNNYHSINHLPGLFCKLEYKIETKSKLAPRFRLGSLQYTEWMEGKQDLYLPYSR